MYKNYAKKSKGGKEMKNLKRVVCIMLVGALVMGMTTGTVFAAGSISNLKFVIENCNISIIKSSETDITYSYDASKFDVTSIAEGTTMIITAKLRNGASAGLLDRVVIYVPEKDYNKIIVESVSAGVTLPELNSNFDVTSNGGSVSFRVMPNYNKSFNCELSGGAGTLKFASDAKDYTVNMFITSSSVSVPSSFTSYTSGQSAYQHINGSGVAQFDITATNSAFSIKCE